VGQSGVPIVHLKAILKFMIAKINMNKVQVHIERCATIPKYHNLRKVLRRVAEFGLSSCGRQTMRVCVSEGLMWLNVAKGVY
jgi:hypothetical protein